MNLSATIAKMEELGMTPDAIITALKCIEFRTEGMTAYNSRPRNNSSKMGPKERWGYDGPITPRLPEKDWLMLRGYILERDNFICGYCGDQGEFEVHWCVDHVVPLSRGGSNDEDNLIACCVPCNNSKSDRLLTEWRGRGK